MLNLLIKNCGSCNKNMIEIDDIRKERNLLRHIINKINHVISLSDNLLQYNELPLNIVDNNSYPIELYKNENI